MTLAAYQQLVDDLVRDRDQVISAEQRNTAIAEAVSRYSLDRPRSRVADVVAAGGQRTATPDGWAEGFSVLQGAEFPIGDIPATQLPLNQVRLYQGPSSTLIELPVSLTTGDSIRYTFTAPHVLDDTSDTIQNAHRAIVCAYAAALLCDQLAGYYATESAPTIQADTVDHADKSRKFAARAKDLRKQYAEALGVDPTRTVAASAIADLDRSASDGGRRLFHSRRGA